MDDARSDDKVNESTIVTEHVGTQTDYRDSEIQTDPLWFREEGLEMLCYRGSYRKLERAKLLARFRDERFALQIQEMHTMTTCADSITSNKVRIVHFSVK